MSIIRKLKIQHFKSIWDDEIDLGQLNVFIGTNGAGKSNVLESIAMASSSVEGGIDYERLNRRGARLSSPDIFRSSFKNKNRNSTFSINIEMDDCSYNMSVCSKDGFPYHSESVFDKEKHRIAGRSRAGVKVNDINIKLSPDKSILPIVMGMTQDSLGLSNLEHFGIYLPSTPILRGTAEDSSKRGPLGLYGGRLAEALAELIRSNKKNQKEKELHRFFKFFDWYKSIGSTNNIDESLLSSDLLVAGKSIVKYTDTYMRTDFNNLYAYDVSEGALYILFVLVLLFHEKAPKILALDNIDSALNPGLVRDLTNHIVQILKDDSSRQIFMTTHNPTTLDAIDLFDNTHRLFVVERMSDGQTKTRRISPPDGMTKEEWEDDYYGMKLSDIWLSGAIGGLPKGF